MSLPRMLGERGWLEREKGRRVEGGKVKERNVSGRAGGEQCQKKLDEKNCPKLKIICWISDMLVTVNSVTADG